MDYRDERDALRGRVESLEDQLAAAQQALAAAQIEPPVAPVPREARAVRAAVRSFGCFGALFAAFWPLVFTPLMVTALGPLVVPSIGRLVAPIVCPEAYVRSTVNTWATWHGDGETSEHWELQCIDVAGGAHPAPDVPTWAALFALTDVVVITGLGAFFVASVLFGRRRRRLTTR